MPLLLVTAAVLMLLILIIPLRLNAFLLLILVSFALGLAKGMTVPETIKSVENNVGSTLGSLALILGYGAMLGNLILESGAAQRITFSLIQQFGENILRPW